MLQHYPQQTLGDLRRYYTDFQDTKAAKVKRTAQVLILGRSERRADLKRFGQEAAGYSCVQAQVHVSAIVLETVSQGARSLG